MNHLKSFVILMFLFGIGNIVSATESQDTTPHPSPLKMPIQQPNQPNRNDIRELSGKVVKITGSAITFEPFATNPMMTSSNKITIITDTHTKIYRTQQKDVKILQKELEEYQKNLAAKSKDEIVAGPPNPSQESPSALNDIQIGDQIRVNGELRSGNQEALRAQTIHIMEFPMANIASVPIIKTNIQGKIIEIQNSIITLEPFAINPFRSSQKVKVVFNQKTKIVQLVDKDPAIYQKELNEFQKNIDSKSTKIKNQYTGLMALPPERYQKRKVSYSELKKGTIVDITADQDNSQKEALKAVEIQIQRSQQQILYLNPKDQIVYFSGKIVDVKGTTIILKEPISSPDAQSSLELQLATDKKTKIVRSTPKDPSILEKENTAYKKNLTTRNLKEPHLLAPPSHFQEQNLSVKDFKKNNVIFVSATPPTENQKLWIAQDISLALEQKVPAPGENPNLINTISGKVLEVRGSALILDVSTVDPDNTSSQMITVKLDEKTKILQLTLKDPDTYQKEIEKYQSLDTQFSIDPQRPNSSPTPPPIPFQEKIVSREKIKKGDILNVMSSEYTQDKKTWTAQEIKITPPIIPIQPSNTIVPPPASPSDTTSQSPSAP